METSSIVLLCILATCSVWAVHGRTLEINMSEEEQDSGDSSVEAQALPGKCWVCKWVLNKLKKFAGPNATAETLKSKLLSVCDEIGLLKPACRKFVKSHLGELIEELTTTDDVRTICVNTEACKPKQTLDFILSPNKDKQCIEINDFF
ncbi:antimicrobial peptide NK-lysin-like [Gouania willdenowi]|uniref:Antimicrobial peptide NK-lysin-like n=1 Tax=Gouania willdenowi TaxID=441366 RepID=A0A8C5GUE9_GOUWI|nr:antimicrobial peptide NK-lysin-like [Gouania willdenowi]